MTPEVKQRIEQIRRGEVPEKYRKRATGIVPCDWAEYSLGEIYKERKLAGDPKLPILTVSIHSGVSDGALNEEELGKKVKRIEDKTQYKTAKAGDLVFNMMRAWQGAIGVACSDGLVSPAYIVAKPEREVFPLFMDYYTKQPRMVNMIHRQSYGVTDFRLRLYWDSFAQIQISLPQIAEQKRIVEILSTQDRVIELLEKKVEQLRLLKKSYMQKMFPRAGSSVPEVRFSGFAGPWEQRKLGDLVQFSKGTGYSKGDLRESGTPIILYGRLYTKYETVISEVDTFADAKAGSVYSRGGEVIVPASGETAEDISIASVVEKSGVLLGGDLNIITPPADLDAPFLAISISNGKPHEDMAKMAQGKSVVHLHNTDLEKIDLTYPSHEEQIQISGYFGALDNIITLHQRKRDEEVRKKQALMQLLLTGIVRV